MNINCYSFSLSLHFAGPPKFISTPPNHENQCELTFLKYDWNIHPWILTVLKRFISIFAGPPKFISTPPDHVVFQENAEASLQCQGSGVPFPTIKWYRQGELITSNSRITLSGDTITIKRVVRGDVGTYSCVAENSEGSVINDTRFVVEGNFLFLSSYFILFIKEGIVSET